jgi:hypothetical protein
MRYLYLLPCIIGCSGAPFTVIAESTVEGTYSDASEADAGMHDGLAHKSPIEGGEDVSPGLPEVSADAELPKTPDAQNAQDAQDTQDAQEEASTPLGCTPDTTLCMALSCGGGAFNGIPQGVIGRCSKDGTWVPQGTCCNLQ